MTDEPPIDPMTPIYPPTCSRHCEWCEGDDHHWMGDCDDEGEPILVCKHCDAEKPMPDDWDEDGLSDGEIDE